jgi:hypothetical protein
MVYYPFSAMIALFINIMQNPRQPSARVDLKLIADARRIFDKLHVRSDVAEKMTALACRFEREATIAVQSLNRKDRQSKLVNNSMAVTSKTSSSTIYPSETDADYAGIRNTPEKDCESQQREKIPSANTDHVAGLHGSTSNHHIPNLAPSFDWSGWDHEPTNVGGAIDEMHQLQPVSSYSLLEDFQESTWPPGQQYTNAPDFWQAPVNFEWDQWAAFVSRFPGEALDWHLD